MAQFDTCFAGDNIMLMGYWQSDTEARMVVSVRVSMRKLFGAYAWDAILSR